MDLLMRFKWTWRRRKQTQNCAALLHLSTRADILKRVKHRNLRCSALRGLRCKTVSRTLRGAGESRPRTVLPCPPSQLALTYSNVWITETCAALPCMGCVACVSMCVRPYSQWQGLAWLNVIPLNIVIKCVISMSTSLCLQGGDSKIRKLMHVHCHLKAGVKTAWIGINLQAPFFFCAVGHLARDLLWGCPCLYPHQCDYPITSYISWRQWSSTDKNARQFLFVTSLNYDVMEICVVHVAVQT